MSQSLRKTIAVVAMLCMILSTDAFAGPGASGGKQKQKMGFFAKIGKAIKTATNKAKMAVKKAAQKTAKAVKDVAQKTGNAIKTAAKKTGMAIKTAGAKIVNAGMDTGVWAKQKLLGKKNKVWVCGHYDKNGKWIKGHWRKLNSGKPGKPGNGGGNYADQSNGGGDSSDMPSDNSGAAGDNGSNGDEAPVASEDPVLPELPSDDNSQSAQSEQSEQSDQSDQTSQDSEQTSQTSDQTSQSSDQAAQFSFDKEISMRTMGMLMDDIVKQSKSINRFKRTAKNNIAYSVEVQSDVNTTYEVREDDAGLLARVVAWDIQTHNGEGGKYYNFFINKMKTMDPKNRALIKDVVVQIRAAVVHGSNNAASEEEKAMYSNRLAELASY